MSSIAEPSPTNTHKYRETIIIIGSLALEEVRDGEVAFACDLCEIRRGREVVGVGKDGARALGEVGVVVGFHFHHSEDGRTIGENTSSTDFFSDIQ